jgi:hypothetical protein
MIKTSLLDSSSFPSYLNKNIQKMSPSASSGVGVAHLPNQRHKIVSKRGANFTLMVCGKFHNEIRGCRDIEMPFDR